MVSNNNQKARVDSYLNRNNITADNSQQWMRLFKAAEKNLPTGNQVNNEPVDDLVKTQINRSRLNKLVHSKTNTSPVDEIEQTQTSRSQIRSGF